MPKRTDIQSVLILGAGRITLEPRVVARGAEKGGQTVEAVKQLLKGLGQGKILLKLSEDGLAISDRREVAGWSREDTFDEARVGQKAIAADFDGAIRAHELGEKEVVDEVFRLPRSATGGHRVELAFDLARARATEKSEIEQVGQPIGVGVDFGGRSQEIREREILELTAPPRSESIS